MKLAANHPSLDELTEALKQYRIFGRMGAEFIKDLANRMTWHFLPGGSLLFEQGQEGASLYVVLGGRLRVYTTKKGERSQLGEVAQGEVVGELAVLTGGRRSATVVALRDSYIVELSKASFDELVESYPKLMMQISRFIVRRMLRYLHDSTPSHSIHNFAVAGVSPAVDVEDFTVKLVTSLEKLGSARLLVASRLADETGDRWQDMSVDLAHNRFLGDWLNQLERQYRFLVYQCDPNNLPWTGRSLRQADCLLMLADASSQPCGLSQSLSGIQGVRNVGRRELVLLHPAGTALPKNSKAWLAEYPDTPHHHVRLDVVSDYERLARLISGRALGLVLGGGGARGYAHIGVIRAFHERRIPIDLVGGASMGALVGAQLAMGWDVEQITAANRRLFIEGGSLWDYTLPLIALTRGKRFERAGKELFGDLMIEDLWLNFFCITSNLSKAHQEVHQRGLLSRYLRASAALPGLMPPIYDNGEVLVDGGLMNNVPVDVMNALDRGSICAVDVSPGSDATLQGYGVEPPSPWRLLLNKLNPLYKGAHIPSILNIMVRSATLTNVSGLERLKNHIALYLDPPMEQVSMLNWKDLDRVSQLGYEYACKRLENFELPN